MARKHFGNLQLFAQIKNLDYLYKRPTDIISRYLSLNIDIGF